MRPIISQWKADMLRTVRDRRFFLLSLGMPVAFYLIFISEVGHDVRIAGTDWGAYFMVSMAAFGVVGSAVNTLGVRLAAERKSGWVRWLRTTPLSGAGYAISKILTQLTLSALIVCVIFALAYWDQGVRLSAVHWIELLLWLTVGSVPFAALGVLISLAGNAAQVLGTLTYLVLSFLGGLWTPIEALPHTLRTVAEWMPTYRLGQPGWDMIANRVVPLEPVAILIGYGLVFLALAAIGQQRIDTQSES